jgi:transcription-repair coupling factor (superfamily II helicase)
VRSIGAVKSMLSRTVPEATFDIAHGQMKSKDLEKVMFDFLNKKFDCLICTMIVESGLDLPNVNTMIVNRADKMGLAQLYQLRGRIGRSDKQAYAYLLIPPKMSLTKEARTRLETISHFSELGAGFQVALKDLEIRGAGNLLGAEQSGFINSVGFDLYSRLLEDAVIEVQSELSGDKTQAPLRKENSELEIKIDLDTDIHIPENYIFEQDLRVNIYRKLASCGTNEELMKLEREMKDRFGSFPKALNNLFCLLKLKILSQQSEISALKINSDYMNLVFKNFPQGYRDLIQKSVACGSQNQIEFSAGPPFSLKYHFEPCESFEQKFLQAESFLLCIKK